MTFGQLLERTRTQKQITQHAMARRASVSSATYQAWERGEGLPTPEHIRMMFANGAPHVLNALREALRAPAPAPEAPKVCPPAPPPSFGAELRRAREAEGLQQGEVANLVGGVTLTRQAVESWENGRVVPVLEHYQALLDLFPALREGPRAAARDIPKPDGGRDVPRPQGPARPPTPIPPSMPAPPPVAKESPAMPPQPFPAMSALSSPAVPVPSDGLVLLEGVIRLARSLYPSSKAAKLTMEIGPDGTVAIALAFGSESAVARGSGKSARAALKEVAAPLRAELDERRRVLDELALTMPGEGA